MPVAVNDKLEIKAYCALGDQVGINVRHWTVSATTGGSLTEQQVADAYSQQLAPIMQSLISAYSKYLGVTLQTISITPKPAAVISTAGQGDGSNGGAHLPKQTCGFLRLKTAGSGRKSRGRVYTPFPPHLLTNTEGEPNPDMIDHLNALGNFYASSRGFVVGGATVVISPVIRNRAANEYSAVVNFETVPKWATQKRRGDFGRQNPIPF